MTLCTGATKTINIVAIEDGMNPPDLPLCLDNRDAQLTTA